MRTAAVVPIGPDASLLPGCLEALRAQERALDSIVVVDDSPDGRLVPPPGVTVVRSGGRGPYAARNVGWQACLDAELILFLDIRSRPRPDWTEQVVPLFDDATVAIAGTDITVLGGDSLAAKTSQYHQFFRMRWYVTEGFFRPYLPTCNLGVRTTDLQAVRGFRETRSGGDADLCWRILDRPHRRLATHPRPVMDWVPRTSVREYLEQNYRYGGSNRALRAAWEGAGAPQMTPRRRRRLLRKAAYIAFRLAVSTVRRRHEQRVIWLRRAGRVAFQFGFRNEPDPGEGLGPEAAGLPRAGGAVARRGS